MPALFQVDTRLITVTNMLSLICLILWCKALECDVQLVLAIDMLAWLPVERWVLRMMYTDETGFYHTPGEYAAIKLRRKYYLASVLAVLFRTNSAACATLVPDQHAAPEPSGHLSLFALASACYVFVRTFLTDCVGYVTADDSHVAADKVVTPTNTFVITDDEDENTDNVEM